MASSHKDYESKKFFPLCFVTEGLSLTLASQDKEGKNSMGGGWGGQEDTASNVSVTSGVSRTSWLA